jgi:hypothetical protein
MHIDLPSDDWTPDSVKSADMRLLWLSSLVPTTVTITRR